MKEITAEQLMEQWHAVPVDVRSPIEYEESHIPGAVNIPLFTNEERIEIGTLYKQKGNMAARWRAMEIVAPKIPAILEAIKDVQESVGRTIIYCARGGMRSGAVAVFLELAGLEAIRLAGGYKAYRQFILERLPSLIPNQAIVLHGMTGTGKTELLQKLKKKGYPVLDLEEMAGHRGSLFGEMGIEKEGNNQKTFDSLLYEGLKEIKGSAFFIIEAESQRIGKARQPEKLYQKN